MTRNKNLKEIDVNIEKVIENVKELLEKCHKKLIENTGIPRNRLRIDLGSTEGDIGIETVWDGNKIVDNNKIKGNYNDKG